MILKLDNLINNKELALPYIFETSDMKNELNQKFSIYKSNIKHLVSERIYDNIELMCKIIIDCISLYYNGKTQEAYSLFEKNLTLLIKSSFYFTNKGVKDEIKYLFRIRETNLQYFDRKDIFHIPFNQRRKVKSYRYSISGHPSLYLSSSIDVCRMETNINLDSNGIVAAFRFSNYVNLRILDLTKRLNQLNVDLIDISHNDNYPKEVGDYLIIYPLIAACSIKKYEDNASFNPEYIISQILMQWLGSNQEDYQIYGIKYITTRVRFPKIKGYNYAFPTHCYNDQENYCFELKYALEVSEPIKFSNLRDSRILENQLLNNKFSII